ncbi:purine-nucleoside phosphorylase [Tindallia magadiensis]|uniref:Purine nucleoside phosphorylase DeoD-type n=1 Tax=Tindallia magadiensis TaxID=69895 RepID=A0A1I3AYZ1_9FIRM|nr:purine-nucleoside phosphorylase [Tindallia magadiensis]SFH55273.1 purine-nucleoside phosphorylase [Tindallia magadiensis]
MSIHISAKSGEVAETILLPGDPLRAKYIADNYLEEAVCFNEVRGMYGFTGYYKGKRVSVSGTGMGIPSISIYVNELIREYNVKNLIRIGSCGSLQEDVAIRDIIIAMSANTDSNVNNIRFPQRNFAPTANFSLLEKAVETARTKGLDPKVGSVLTSDSFYHEDPEEWKMWASYGVLAVEMETAELYSLAAKYGVKALSVLTVSDHFITGEQTTSEERQKTFNDMMEIALSLA